MRRQGAEMHQMVLGVSKGPITVFAPSRWPGVEQILQRLRKTLRIVED